MLECTIDWVWVQLVIDGFLMETEMGMIRALPPSGELTTIVLLNRSSFIAEIFED